MEDSTIELGSEILLRHRLMALLAQQAGLVERLGMQPGDDIRQFAEELRERWAVSVRAGSGDPLLDRAGTPTARRSALIVTGTVTETASSGVTASTPMPALVEEARHVEGTHQELLGEIADEPVSAAGTEISYLETGQTEPTLHERAPWRRPLLVPAEPSTAARPAKVNSHEVERDTSTSQPLPISAQEIEAAVAPLRDVLLQTNSGIPVPTHMRVRSTQADSRTSIPRRRRSASQRNPQRARRHACPSRAAPRYSEEQSPHRGGCSHPALAGPGRHSPAKPWATGLPGSSASGGSRPERDARNAARALLRSRGEECDARSPATRHAVRCHAAKLFTRNPEAPSISWTSRGYIAGCLPRGERIHRQTRPAEADARGGTGGRAVVSASSGDCASQAVSFPGAFRSRCRQLRKIDAGAKSSARRFGGAGHRAASAAASAPDARPGRDHRASVATVCARVRP